MLLVNLADAALIIAAQGFDIAVVGVHLCSDWWIGHWSLDIGHWTLVIGHWSLVIGHWSLVIGHWSLDIGHWSLVIGHWSLVIHWWIGVSYIIPLFGSTKSKTERR